MECHFPLLLCWHAKKTKTKANIYSNWDRIGASDTIRSLQLRAVFSIQRSSCLWKIGRCKKADVKPIGRYYGHSVTSGFAPSTPRPSSSASVPSWHNRLEFDLYKIIHTDRKVSRLILHYSVFFLIFSDNSDRKSKFCDPLNERMT